MVKGAFRNFFKRMVSKILGRKGDLKLGFYGPPNAGKTSLANRICKDFTGEEMGSTSNVPHETRTVQFKEKVEISYKGKSMTFKLIDTPGIATRIDYEEFLKYKVNKKEAKTRAKEATQGVIESIKWLDDMDVVVIVLDSTKNPYNQVNLTIIGNLAARKIPVLIVANKVGLRKFIIGAFFISMSSEKTTSPFRLKENSYSPRSSGRTNPALSK